MQQIISLLNDIRTNKFKTRNGTVLFHDIEKLKADKRFIEFLKWINENYHEKGMGIKYLIKHFELPITYSVLRTILKLSGIKLHSDRVANEWLSSIRKEQCKINMENREGWFKQSVIRSHNHKGYQGKYFNKSLQKLVHLRSTYEFIFAKWLDSKNIIWDTEVKSFKLSTGGWYTPDFFIFEGEKLTKIVEVKGWKDTRFFKVEALRNQLQEKIEIATILGEEIIAYSQDFKKDITEWKQITKQQQLELKA